MKRIKGIIIVLTFVTFISCSQSSEKTFDTVKKPLKTSDNSVTNEAVIQDYNKWKTDDIADIITKLKISYMIPQTYKIENKYNNKKVSATLSDISTKGEKKIYIEYISNFIYGEKIDINDIYKSNNEKIKRDLFHCKELLNEQKQILINNQSYTYFGNSDYGLFIYYGIYGKGLYFIATNSKYHKQTMSFINSIKFSILTNTEIANYNMDSNSEDKVIKVEQENQNKQEKSTIASKEINKNNNQSTKDNGSSNGFKTYDKTFENNVEYVGNTKTMKFHVKTCDSVEKILPNNVVILKSSTEAVRRGYSPCKRCNPK